MSKEYIELERMPSLDDFAAVVASADAPCYCTDEMKEQVIVDGEVETCKGCAARKVLNCVATLSDRLQKVM